MNQDKKDKLIHKLNFISHFSEIFESEIKELEKENWNEVLICLGLKVHGVLEVIAEVMKEEGVDMTKIHVPVTVQKDHYLVERIKSLKEDSMNGAAKEMSLEEYVGVLCESHKATKEYRELKRIIAEMETELKSFKSDISKTDEQLGAPEPEDGADRVVCHYQGKCINKDETTMDAVSFCDEQNTVCLKNEEAKPTYEVDTKEE